MLELPEALTLASQLSAVYGKTVERVLPPTKEHRLCWFNGEPTLYNGALQGAALHASSAFGMYAEMGFDNGMYVAVNDGIHVRLTTADALPASYQLAVCFTDGSALAFTVAMYGGIVLHDYAYQNEYYDKSKAACSPFSDAFPAWYQGVLAACKPTTSAKAFLATEQRFPGIGNGVLQDILFGAGIHPKRKLASFSDAEHEQLLSSIQTTLRAMTDARGRDTESDLYGVPGGYKTKMSKIALKSGCCQCGMPIEKETYMGGAVYFCPFCQKL